MNPYNVSIKLTHQRSKAHRLSGWDALAPNPKGQPLMPRPEVAAVEPDVVQRLRAENQSLRAQVAYLEKLKALRDQQRP